jgi:hypothetical protein
MAIPLPERAHEDEGAQIADVGGRAARITLARIHSRRSTDAGSVRAALRTAG